jgi:uncharacterized coiled-coil protein SlyX
MNSIKSKVDPKTTLVLKLKLLNKLFMDTKQTIKTMKDLQWILFIFFLLGGAAINGQTIEELQTQKAEKEGQIAELQGQMDVLQGELGGIQGQIDAFPGWETGTFGTLGFNLSRFSNWAKGAQPNSTSSTIGGSFSGFANYDDPKFFWRNSGNINLAWQKLTLDRDDPAEEDSDYESVADVFKVTSLYGHKISESFAISVLGEYNTSIINNFNNPGILDIGVGATWTPVKNLVVVIHPLNYHWVFGDNPDFDSALGAKVVADYVAELTPGLTWRSNLSMFFPYKSTEPSLSEYTWTNGLSFKVLGGIGVGLEYAIRKADVESPDSQNYFIMGLTYTL